jgi:sn-glycerol 3-phosphate transport system substrate-binding protein
MMVQTLAATAATPIVVERSTQAAGTEFLYGTIRVVGAAIKAQCDALTASQFQDRITCAGQGGYETGMQKPIARHEQIVSRSQLKAIPARYPA